MTAHVTNWNATLSAAASLIWCLAFGIAGYALGSNWDSVHHAFRYAGYGAIAAALLLRLGRTRTA